MRKLTLVIALLLALVIYAALIPASWPCPLSGGYAANNGSVTVYPLGSTDFTCQYSIDVNGTQIYQEVMK